MTTINKNIRVIKNFSAIDESFVRNRTANFHLSLSIGIEGVRYVVLDIKNNRYIALESFTFQGANSSSALVEAILEVLEKNEIAHNLFKSIQISIENDKSTIIPIALYEKGNELSYLSLTSEVMPLDEILTYDIKNVNAKIIFAVDNELIKKIKKYFPNAKINHHSSALIEGILTSYKNQVGKKMFINVQMTHFEIVVLENSEFIYFNSFKHQSSEDFLYFVLFVCEQLGLNPETIELMLLGEVEKNSAIYTILHKYIRTINLGSRNESFLYSHTFQDIQKHFHFTLFNQFLCA